MSKSSFVVVIFSALLLGSCGFHVPYQGQINATITGNTNSDFATTLKQHFDKNTSQTLVIQIGDEILKKQATSYDDDGVEQSYILSLTIPINITNSNQQVLFSKNLTASSYFSKTGLSRADDLEMAENYNQLRQTIAKRLLTILYRLNEN